VNFITYISVSYLARYRKRSEYGSLLQEYSEGSHRKTDPYSRGREHLISKHINISEKKMVMGPGGAQNKKMAVLMKTSSKLLLCSRVLPRAIPFHLIDLNDKFSYLDEFYPLPSSPWQILISRCRRHFYYTKTTTYT
jgi:hypothetical protein